MAVKIDFLFNFFFKNTKSIERQLVSSFDSHISLKKEKYNSKIIRIKNRKNRKLFYNNFLCIFVCI